MPPTYLRSSRRITSQISAYDVHMKYFHHRQSRASLQSCTQLNFSGKPAVSAWDRLCGREMFTYAAAVASKVYEKPLFWTNSTPTSLTTNALHPTKAVIKKAHSTEILNIQLTDNVLEAMDKTQITSLVLLDLSKAFDSIDHARLLHKLSITGASPSTVHYFFAFIWMIYPWHLGILTWNHTLTIRSYFCLSSNRPGRGLIEKLEDLFRVAQWCYENHLLINQD